MTGKIYLLSETEGLGAMHETPYESEKLLQELLAKHPDLVDPVECQRFRAALDWMLEVIRGTEPS